MSRRSVRDAWVAEVRRSTEIGDACRVLLLTMAAEGMTEKGYVSIPRTKLAELLDRHPQRITERIAEAINKGFLVRLHAGHRGRSGEGGKTSSYAANLPAMAAKGNGRAVTNPSAEGPKDNGSAVTLNRLPISGLASRCEARKVTGERLPNTGAHVRVTYRNREQEPAPGDGRAERDHDGTSQAGSNREWLPTPVADASPDPTGRVA